MAIVLKLKWHFSKESLNVMLVTSVVDQFKDGARA